MKERIPKPVHKQPDMADTCTVEYACAYNEALEISEAYHQQEIQRLQSAVMTEEEMYKIMKIWMENNNYGWGRHILKSLSKTIHEAQMRRMRGEGEDE